MLEISRARQKQDARGDEIRGRASKTDHMRDRQALPRKEGEGKVRGERMLVDEL